MGPARNGGRWRTRRTPQPDRPMGSESGGGSTVDNGIGKNGIGNKSIGNDGIGNKSIES